jgi:hypothetical protein
MPFRALSDFEDAAKYQKNLKAALAEAHVKSLPVTLIESFPFKEQTASPLVVGKLDAGLAKKIVESGANKLAEGTCACAGSQMFVLKLPR